MCGWTGLIALQLLREMDTLGSETDIGGIVWLWLLLAHLQFNFLEIVLTFPFRHFTTHQALDPIINISKYYQKY